MKTLLRDERRIEVDLRFSLFHSFMSSASVSGRKMLYPWTSDSWPVRYPPPPLPLLF